MKKAAPRHIGKSRSVRAASPKRVAAKPVPTPELEGTPEGPSHGFGVVAVGASAGGLEAFSQVLAHLPTPSELAFVLVQHLSPQHASSLPELLASKTALAVVTAADRMPIEPGRVYVTPPNVQMEVVEGELRLLPRPTDRSQFTPIDFFMQSVARWAQDRAIGVILSGTASDGAAGIREIKALGGITIAQKPDTAKHDGMPQAAIATGMVDLILSPAQIAEQLGRVRTHPYLHRSTDDMPGPDVAIAEKQLQDLFVLLRRASGIDFKHYKTPTVKRRLLRRMALLRLTEIEGYLRHVSATPAEAQALSQDLLIHVTRFFRDPDAFESMRTHVFSELLHDRGGEDTVRIWVPGCASGEEAYSIGMGLLEASRDRAFDRRIQIFATDVSDGAIEMARSGAYPVSISADVSSERLKRFFTKSDGSYCVIKPLRDMCVFARHDLTRDPPFSRLDFIACRNVLIYLDATLQKRLISVFHYALRNRGFLMLGPAETPGPQGAFAVVDKKWRLFRKQPAELALPYSTPRDAHLPPAAPIPARAKVHVDGKSVQDEATRLILDRYGPPGVVVDSDLQIVQFRGHTGPYLEAAAGEPNLNVLKMARGGLLHALRSALRLAKSRARLVRKTHVNVQRNGAWTEITLEVVPLTTLRGEHYLILFDESESQRANTSRRKKPAAATRAAVNRENHLRVSDLRRELAANREYLQSIIQELEAANEELQSANEEILSSNEELQSTNEELDTAKEELQSTNEELNTVNDELHSRNEELTRVNSDLSNLLNSVDIPIVIVGGDLAIRRFTQRAEQLFNLIAGDVGRPIGQIKPNFRCDDLEGLIRETIDSIAPRERDVQDRSDRWLSLRVRPYKGVDNRLDGAVISVFDIDVARRHQTFVEHARDYFRGIVDAIREPMVVLDSRGRVRTGNRSFCEIYALDHASIEGRDFTRIGDGRWDSADVAGLLEDATRRRKRTERVIEHQVPSRGKVRARFVANQLPLEDAQEGILIVIQDIAGGETNA